MVNPNTKILSAESMKKVILETRKEYEGSKKFVFTNGCFDIIHPGHIYSLCEARNLGDFLIVALNTDESVKLIKGENRPVLKLIDRQLIMASLYFVDYVVSFPEKDPRGMLELLKPDIHVKGGDYRKEEIIEKDVVESYGGRIEIIPFKPGYSTTKIIEKIKKISLNN